MSTKKETTKSTKTNATSKKSEGFTAEEKAAMKARVQELKAEARASKNRAEGERVILAAINALKEPDRSMAKRIHGIVTATAPALWPKTWYGMPAYANDEGKVVCFFQSAQKFGARYATFGFNDTANLDEGHMAYQTAAAQVKVAQAQLVILKAGARQEQIAVTEAAVKQAEAGLTTLQVQRDQHTLVAPLTGWVVEQLAHEGEMSTPGITLLTLADLYQMTLTVYVPEPKIGLVSVGQKVQVFVDTFPGEAFTGEITFINDEAEFTPKNVQSKEERVNTVFAVKI